MKPVRPLRLLHLAEKDGENAYDWYVAQTSIEVAHRFADALGSTFALIAQDPSLGSRRYSERFDFVNLRFQSVKGFPYLVFYAVQEDHIDIWRVLHEGRDIPRHLHAGD